VQGVQAYPQTILFVENPGKIPENPNKIPKKLGKNGAWNRQDCNKQSTQRLQNTCSIGTGWCLNAWTQM